jgi:tetratricopeptide (TPR) repeat protein
MFKKIFIGLGLFIALIAAGAGSTFAQTAPAEGVVKLKKADGTIEPVEGALVEPYRMDVSRGKLPSTKTNRRGEFSFVGFMHGHNIALAISGPGIAPRVHPGVKAGMSGIEIIVEPGDGAVLTEDEVRSAGAAAVDLGGEASAAAAEDAAKAKAEYEAKVKEVEDRNRRVEQANKIIAESLKAGNEAFEAKNYDVAVVKYQEGIAADPEYLGSVPIFLSNMGLAHTNRAVATYNANARSTDTAVKNEAMKRVQDDLGAAAAAFFRSWTMLKNPAGEALSAAQVKEQRDKAISGAREAYRLMVETERVDPAQTDNARSFLNDIADAETDATAKAAAKTMIGDLYRVAGNSEDSIAAYREALKLDSKSINAMAGLGLSLFAEGAGTEDRAMMQEGLNYMQAFVDTAPDNHKLKASVIEAIDYLKTAEKLSPQRLPR